MSDACFEALEKMKWEVKDGKKYPIGLKATPWMHLQDALYKKTVTPMECYDAIKLGYVPEHLKIRESRYKHLI